MLKNMVESIGNAFFVYKYIELCRSLFAAQETGSTLLIRFSRYISSQILYLKTFTNIKIFGILSKQGIS